MLWASIFFTISEIQVSQCLDRCLAGLRRRLYYLCGALDGQLAGQLYHVLFHRERLRKLGRSSLGGRRRSEHGRDVREERGDGYRGSARRQPQSSWRKRVNEFQGTAASQRYVLVEREGHDRQ